MPQQAKPPAPFFFQNKGRGNMNIGFLGTGNMGGAIISGYAGQAGKNGDILLAYDLNTDKLTALASKTGLLPCESQEDLINRSDVVVLGLKPNLFDAVLPQIAPFVLEGKVIVTMAAGISIGFIESHLGSDTPIIRIMPNTPAMVNQGMTSVSRNANVDDATFQRIFAMFTAIGRAEEVPEELIHCVIGVSGSSPAYTYMYIDALANEAVKNGMDYNQAVIFAAQSVLGAATMVLETGETPEQLRINVCSPGGTTIEAVRVLQANGFEENVAQGFRAAVAKSKEMSK
jgi:pyrroline-5-carboxylate reductase